MLSGVCATIHMKKSKAHVYEALDDGEMAELNTPYMGDKYGSTGDGAVDKNRADTDL